MEPVSQGDTIMPKFLPWYKKGSTEMNEGNGWSKSLQHSPGTNITFSTGSPLPFFFPFGCTWGTWKFPGLGLNPHHSSNPGHCSDNTGSLTHWTTGELQWELFLNQTFFMNHSRNGKVYSTFWRKNILAPNSIIKHCKIKHQICSVRTQKSNQFQCTLWKQLLEENVLEQNESGIQGRE